MDYGKKHDEATLREAKEEMEKAKELRDKVKRELDELKSISKKTELDHEYISTMGHDLECVESEYEYKKRYYEMLKA